MLIMYELVVDLVVWIFADRVLPISDKEDNEMWVNSYGLHAFTTGRRHLPAKSTRPKGSSQTLKVSIVSLSLAWLA